MPHIRFRAIKEDHVEKLSALLCKDLANAMETSEDNFTFELIETQFFAQGKKVESYPFVEVSWFARSQEIQDLSAKIITEKVKTLAGYEDVIVVFQALPKTNYYENGEHF